MGSASREASADTGRRRAPPACCSWFEWLVYWDILNPSLSLFFLHKLGNNTCPLPLTSQSGCAGRSLCQAALGFLLCLLKPQTDPSEVSECTSWLPLPPSPLKWKAKLRGFNREFPHSVHPAHNGLTAAHPPSCGFEFECQPASQPISPLVDCSGPPPAVMEYRLWGLHRQCLLQATGLLSLRRAFVEILLSSVQAGQYQTAGSQCSLDPTGVIQD